MNYKKHNYFGREKELKILNEKYRSKTFEFITISGKSGDGKTALIKEFVEEKRAILFKAIRSNASHNYSALSKSISKAMYSRLRSLVNFNDMSDALDFVIKMAEKERIVLVIDDYDNLFHSVKDISIVMREYISRMFSGKNIMLILTGPEKFLSEQKFGKVPTSLVLKKLSFSEVKPHFRNRYSDEDLLMLYGITGGNPEYVNYIDSGKSIQDNIESLFLDSAGPMYTVPILKATTDMRNPEVYDSIMYAVSTGTPKIREIMELSDIQSSATCSTYLSNLIDLGIIVKMLPFNEKTIRNGRYGLTDLSLRFWYAVVHENQSLIEYKSEGELYSALVEHKFEGFIEDVFRAVCIQFIEENKGFFNMIPGRSGPWWNNKDSIDHIVESQDGMSTMFCECRYHDSLVGMSVLKSLIRRSKSVEVFGTRRYALFSKTGFTDELHEYSERNDITLVTLRDMCWL